MESLLLLKPLIGREKTLVITCRKCGESAFPMKQIGPVVTYYCPGGMLHRHDYVEQKAIRCILEKEECSQLIVMGHYHCPEMRNVLENYSDTFSPNAQYNLEALVRHNELPDALAMDRMLTERNVMDQLKFLKDYYFIKKRLEDHSLTLIGVLADPEAYTVKEIFRNGIHYNDLITSN